MSTKPSPRRRSRSRARPRPRTWCAICSPRWTRWSRPSSRRPALVRAGKLKEAATLEATKAELATPLRDRHRAGEGEPADPFRSTFPICSRHCASSTRRSTRCCRSISRCWRPRTRSPRAHPRRARRGRAQERAADLRQVGPGNRAGAQHRDSDFGQPDALTRAARHSSGFRVNPIRCRACPRMPDAPINHTP